MTRPAISAQDVTVRFRPYLDRIPTMRRSMGSLRRRTTEEIVALDSVSFEIMPGEAFGIIGRNGAGKSTLMRVLARTLRPNSGKVVINGRASTLLQLGVGFNPQLSGRRNIYLGGLAAGMRKSEIDARFDEIVDYSELGTAINRPMKSYSSGMFSRLAFSVSMALDPDILLLDEIFAVGDEGFREKSLETMQGVLDRAGTIVFVSHALNKVAEVCNRAMWLDEGSIVEIDNAGDVVDRYREDAHARRLRRQERRRENAAKAVGADRSPNATQGSGAAGLGAADSVPTKTRLIAHIGLAPIALSLQDFLAQNADQLAEAGIWYPEIGRAGRSSHLNLKRELAGDTRFKPSGGTWDGVLALAKEHRTTVVSCHEFSALTEAEIRLLARKLEGTDATIVINLIRQDELLESTYAQMCAAGRTMKPFDEFMAREAKEDRYRYYDLLEPWADAFGSDRVVVRPLKSQQLVDGTAYAALLDVFGAPSQALDAMQWAPSGFLSTSPEALTVMRSLLESKQGDKDYDQALFGRSVGKLIAEADRKIEWPRGRRHVMSGSQAVDFVSQFEAQNEAVARTYLGREDGVLFADAPDPDEVGGVTDIADIRPSDLVRLLENVIDLPTLSVNM